VYGFNESVNELSDKDIKKAEQIRKSMPGFVGEKFAKKASNEDILSFADLQDKEAQIYNSKIKPIRDAKKKLYKKYRIRESVNEGISVFDERHFGKKGIIIMIDDNGKKVSAIFKDKKNADKFNRNKPSDIKKLLQLAKSKKFPQTIDETVNEDKNQIIQLKKKVNKNEIKFYDALDVVEKKLGKRKYRIFLEKSLKQFGINGNHYDYRTNAAAEEKLFQVAK
jgi:hypothetical protein